MELAPLFLFAFYLLGNSPFFSNLSVITSKSFIYCSPLEVILYVLPSSTISCSFIRRLKNSPKSPSSPPVLRGPIILMKASHTLINPQSFDSSVPGDFELFKALSTSRSSLSENFFPPSAGKITSFLKGWPRSSYRMPPAYFNPLKEIPNYSIFWVSKK